MSADGNTFLVLHGNETDAILAIVVASKATSSPWMVVYVKNAIYELGFGELEIAIKCDGGRELQE